MSDSPYTKEDKACVNCKHMVRSKNPFRWIQRLFGEDTHFYLCLTPDRIHSRFDNITGKITITKKPKSCRGERTDWNCNTEGKRWEPSKEWRSKKENLFKQITADDEK